jgi:hypothetical protein
MKFPWIYRFIGASSIEMGLREILFAMETDACLRPRYRLFAGPRRSIIILSSVVLLIVPHSDAAWLAQIGRAVISCPEQLAGVYQSFVAGTDILE